MYDESDVVSFGRLSIVSCFVENDSLTLEEIRQVSEMCKDMKNVKVCYTHISNLKKGKDTGSVLFKNINRKIVINVS